MLYCNSQNKSSNEYCHLYIPSDDTCPNVANKNGSSRDNGITSEQNASVETHF